MNITNEEQTSLWEGQFPDRKIPGTFEKLPGKCGAKLRDKDLKELGIERYCNKRSGMGTSHLDTGACKWHGGATKNHIKSASKEMVVRQFNELATIAEKLGDAAPIGPPEVEAFQLATKAKQWISIIETEMDKISHQLVTEDQAGIEHARAVIEIWERGVDRFQRFLEFSMKHDLHRRVVELEEQQASVIGAAFMSVILSQDMKLTESQIRIARNLFANSMNDLGDQLAPTWSASLRLNDDDIVDAELVED